jgi:hypothetical protein
LNPSSPSEIGLSLRLAPGRARTANLRYWKNAVFQRVRKGKKRPWDRIDSIQLEKITPQLGQGWKSISRGAATAPNDEAQSLSLSGRDLFQLFRNDRVFRFR